MYLHGTVSLHWSLSWVGVAGGWRAGGCVSVLGSRTPHSDAVIVRRRDQDLKVRIMTWFPKRRQVLSLVNLKTSYAGSCRWCGHATSQRNVELSHQKMLDVYFCHLGLALMKVRMQESRTGLLNNPKSVNGNWYDSIQGVHGHSALLNCAVLRNYFSRQTCTP